MGGRTDFGNGDMCNIPCEETTLVGVNIHAIAKLPIITERDFLILVASATALRSPSAVAIQISIQCYHVFTFYFNVRE